jgi:hypothetical protein
MTQLQSVSSVGTTPELPMVISVPVLESENEIGVAEALPTPAIRVSAAAAAVSLITIVFFQDLRSAS